MIKGKSYLVPTVNGQPVLLPHHHDNYELEHYHYDWRFKEGEPNHNIGMMAGNPVVMQEMICLRESKVTIFPNAFKVWELMCRFKGRRLKCGLCPHKGFLVEGEQCQGHGLLFDDRGRLKHLDEKLGFRITGTKNYVEVGWEFKTTFSFKIIEKCVAKSVDLLAGGKVIAIGTFKDLKEYTVNPGDTLTTNIKPTLE